MNNCTNINDDNNNALDTNTILLILNLVFTTVSTTMLGMRCKLWKTNMGFMASCRPTNSTPSPPNKELGDLRSIDIDIPKANSIP